MYKLVAIDLDGTLLDDSGMLPEANRVYIQKAMDNGVQVALCSGRSYVSLARFENMLGLNKPGCYGICFNGGIVYNVFDKEIISDIRMCRSVAIELAGEIKHAFGNIEPGVMIYVGAELYTERIIEEIAGYARRSGINLTQLQSFDEITQDVTKLVVKGENPSLRMVYNKMRRPVTGRCQMFFTTENLLEFIPLGSGKDRGLQILAKELGIPLNETMAVGDQVNDIDMIKAAGLGVAVSNAIDEVKAVAGYVTRADNNAGVFREIAQMFLGI